MFTTFPNKTKKEIERIISRRHLENNQIIECTEDFFLKQRGFVTRMPKPGTAVILLFSGGIDSTTLLYLLIKKYKLKVYPIVNTSEELGMNYYSKQRINKIINKIKKKNPLLVMSPFFYHHTLVPTEIKKNIFNLFYKNPNKTISLVNKDNIIHREIPDFMNQHISIALQFRELIIQRDNCNLNCIFTGIIANDGDLVKSQTLTSIRSINLNAISSTGNKKLQIIPFFIEKNFNLFLKKESVIEIAEILKVPLRLTWSCYQTRTSHCGICSDCQFRRHTFEKLNVKDETMYLYPNDQVIDLMKKQIKIQFRACLEFISGLNST